MSVFGKRPPHSAAAAAQRRTSGDTSSDVEMPARTRASFAGGLDAKARARPDATPAATTEPTPRRTPRPASRAITDAKADTGGAHPPPPRPGQARAMTGSHRARPYLQVSVARLGDSPLSLRGSPRLLSSPLRKESSGTADLLRACFRLSTGPAPEVIQARDFMARWDGAPITDAAPCFEAVRQLLARAALELPVRAQAHIGEALAAELGGHAMPESRRRELAAALMAHVGLRVRVSSQEDAEASAREIEAVGFAIGVLRGSCRDPDEVRAMVLDMVNWAVAQQRSPDAGTSWASSAGPAFKVKEAAAESPQQRPPLQPPELLLGRIGVLALALGGRQIGPQALRDLLQVLSRLHKAAGHRVRDLLMPEDVAMALGTVCTETGGPKMSELSCRVLVAHLCAPDAAVDAERRAVMVYHAALELGVCDGDGAEFVQSLLHEATASVFLSLVEVGGIAWALGLHLCGADPQRLGWHQTYAPLLVPGCVPVEQVLKALWHQASGLPQPQRERLVSALALVRAQVAADMTDWSSQRYSTSLSTGPTSLVATPSSAASPWAGLTPSAGLTPTAARVSVSALRLSVGSTAEMDGKTDAKTDAKTQQDGFFGRLEPRSLIFEEEQVPREARAAQESLAQPQKESLPSQPSEVSDPAVLSDPVVLSDSSHVSAKAGPFAAPGPSGESRA